MGMKEKRSMKREIMKRKSINEMAGVKSSKLNENNVSVISIENIAENNQRKWQAKAKGAAKSMKSMAGGEISK
jgi:hypothetical protein